MNKEVEQRIVEMQFNNADFETKVQQSLGTLQKLKEATKLEDAGKGLENLASSAHKLDLSSIAQGIEQLNGKFSALGIAGMTVMQRLTNAAIDMGQQIANAITAAPKDGWKEYELNLDSVKTILNSAKGADGLPVTLDKVNEKLNELNEYSDKTIYSFSDMTNNIGKFTNAGVDLDSAVTAIQGVANVAALAGANANDASRAMYNFGQALGSGSVKLIDWKSIENANMATVDFKEQLIQTAVELGTLRTEGDKYVSTTTNMQGKTSDAFTATQGFNDALSSQWMTSEVLTKTLAKYTDETTDLGKAAIEAATQVTTFSKLIDTLKESMGSGWMQTWQYIFGDFEESKELWTGIYKELDGIIQKVSGARNDFLKGWKESGGRKELIESLSNTWYIIKHYVGLITDAFKVAFPKIDAKPIISITKPFNEFTGKVRKGLEAIDEAKKKAEETADAVGEIAERAEKFNEVVQEIIRGDWGNGQERIDRLHEAGYAFENLQNAVNELLGCEKRYETVMSDNEAVGLEATAVTEENADALNEQKKALDAVTDAMKDENPIVRNLAYVLMAVSSSANLVKKAIGGVWNTLSKGASLITVIKNGFKLFLDVIGSISKRVYFMTSWMSSFTSFGQFIAGLRNKLKVISESFNDVGISLDALDSFLEGVGKKLAELKDWIKEVGDTVKENLEDFDYKKIYDILAKAARFLGGAVLIALNTVAKAVRNIYDGLKRLWDTVKEYTVIQNAISAFYEFKEEVANAIEKFKEADVYASVFLPLLAEMAKTLERLAKTFGPVFVSAFEAFLRLLEDVHNKGADAFEAFKEGGVVDNAADVVEKFKGALEDMPGAIKTFFDSIKAGTAAPDITSLPKSITDLVASWGTFASSLDTTAGKMLSDFVGKIRDFIKGLPDATSLGPLKGWVEQLGAAFDSLETTTQNASGTVSSFVHNVIEQISGIDFKNIAIIGLISSISLFVFRWSKVGKSAARTLNALGKFILNGGKVATIAVDKYTGFLRIAAAIGIIAGSIWLLAQVPAKDFKRVAITLGIAFAAMFGAIEFLTFQKIPADTIKAIGIAFAGMGSSFLMVAAAAKILASMSWPEIGKAATALVGFTAMVVAAAKIAGGAGLGTGAAFLGLSLALFMLIPSIKLLDGMDIGTLVKGGIAIYAFTQIMAKAIQKAGESKGGFGAFMGLSLGLFLLIPSIKLLAGMDFKTLIKGGAAVYAFLMMMSKAAKDAGEGNAKGFLSMGIAVGIIAVSLKIMESINWASLVVSSSALQGILKALSVAFSTISEIPFRSLMKTVLAMAACLAVLGGALYLMDTYMTDSTATLKNALSLSAIMVAFSMVGGAVKTLSEIPFAEGVQAAGNAMVFFGAVMICVGALGELDALTNGKAGEAVGRGASVLGNAIKNFLDSLTGGSFSNAFESTVETITHIGEHLSSFGESVKGFLDSIKDMDGNVVTNAKNLALALLAVCGADLLDALTSWVRGKADLSGFSESMVALTTAVVDMNDKLAGVTIDGDKLGSIAKVVTAFSDVAKNIPRSGSWADKILGVRDLSDFADEMSAFVLGGFRKFVRYVNGLGDSVNMAFVLKVSQISTATQAMADLANKLPRSGGKLDWLTGVKDLSDFATEMNNFLKGETGFKAFVTAVNGVGDTGPTLNILRTGVIPITDEMLTLAEKLDGQGNVITNFITGKQDLSQFGSKLAGFGKGMKEFTDNIRGISATHIDGITASAERLAALNASENLKGSSLGAFSECIRTLGAAIAQFNTDTGATDPETFSAAIDKITSLHNLMLILAGTDYSGVSNFSEALAELGSSSATSFIDAFSESSARASEAAKEFIVNVTEGIDSMKSEFGKKGQLSVTEYVAGISKQGRIVLYVYGAAIVGRILAGIASMFDEINKKGVASVLEFCSGINSQDGILKGAGKHIVSKAIDGAKEDIDDFYDLGDDAISGFAQGIKDNAYKAANAARKGVRDALDAGADEQKSASPSKEFAKLGKYGIEGYALGFTKNIGLATSAVRKTAKAGIFAMQEAIANTQNMVSDSIDFNPTITPVMDLTLLEQGLQQTTGLLSGLERVNTDVQAAIDIADAYNAALARSHNTTPTNYTNQFSALLDSNAKLIEAVKRNRYALIDGEQVFNYVDRRFGEA